MIAIAAMAPNRSIGVGGKIPWHIPAEFEWFKKATMSGIVVMGRRTYERRPEPLVGRINVVVTHHLERTLCDIPTQTMVKYATGKEILCWRNLSREVWIAGGESIYQQYLPACSEMYLSIVNRDPVGDAHFPAFEHLFDLVGTVLEEKEFRVLHYRRNKSRVAGVCE